MFNKNFKSVLIPSPFCSSYVIINMLNIQYSHILSWQKQDEFLSGGWNILFDKEFRLVMKFKSNNFPPPPGFWRDSVWVYYIIIKLPGAAPNCMENYLLNFILNINLVIDKLINCNSLKMFLKRNLHLLH